MATFQQTLFLGDVNGTYGWSESYFKDDTDAVASQTSLNTLVNERVKVLCEVCQVVSGRTSDVAISGDSLLSTATPAVGLLVGTNLEMADPWSALNCRFEASSLHRGRKFFHGVLEDTFAADRSYDLGNPNNAAWQAWFAVLVAAGYFLRVGPAPYTYQLLTTIIPIREVERKVGRPFVLLHGRRPIAV